MFLKIKVKSQNIIPSDLISSVSYYYYGSHLCSYFGDSKTRGREIPPKELYLYKYSQKLEAQSMASLGPQIANPPLSREPEEVKCVKFSDAPHFQVSLCGCEEWKTKVRNNKTHVSLNPAPFSAARGAKIPSAHAYTSLSDFLHPPKAEKIILYVYTGFFL